MSQTSKKPKRAPRHTPKGTQTKGMRSRLEAALASHMEAKGLPFEYEPKDAHLDYVKSYVPDFRLPNGILIEAKGFFSSEDRTKMLQVKRANPMADIRMVFKRDNKLNKKSPTRYSQWCERHGFKYHIGTTPPESWWTEKGD